MHSTGSIQHRECRVRRRIPHSTPSGKRALQYLLCDLRFALVVVTFLLLTPITAETGVRGEVKWGSRGAVKRCQPNREACQLCSHFGTERHELGGGLIFALDFEADALHLKAPRLHARLQLVLLFAEVRRHQRQRRQFARHLRLFGAQLRVFGVHALARGAAARHSTAQRSAAHTVNHCTAQSRGEERRGEEGRGEKWYQMAAA
jgi:hypothetical protein